MKSIFHILMFVFLFACVESTVVSSQAWAQQPAPPAQPPAAPPTDPEALPEDTCTNAPVFQQKRVAGIISSVVTDVDRMVNRAGETLFKGIVENSSFKSALYWSITLFIVIYGVMFMFGMVQLTFGELLVRVSKIAVILALLAPGGVGWDFFSGTVKEFFNDGTQDLINKMSQLTAGINGTGGCVTTGNQPAVLCVLDSAIATVFSMKFFVMLIGASTTLPYGPVIGLLIIAGTGEFIGAIMQAIYVYLMSLIAKALLFGLAPIFITCLMFQRTKQLFDGWLSQLVNYSLQPIFLFAFLGFYANLIRQSMQSILKTDWCYEDTGGIMGVFKFRLPRGVDPETGSAKTVDAGFDGAKILDNNGNVIHNTKDIFPIDIVDVLIFYLVANLAWRYTTVVVSIAREIANSSVFLSDMSGALKGAFTGAKDTVAAAVQGGTAGAVTAAGPRTAAGRTGSQFAMNQQRSGPKK